MIILAFDSTAKVATAAICDGQHLLSLYTIDNGLTQSELLLPMAEDMLKSLKLTFDNIELLACSVGPGSFTGVRIGTALVKGLAFSKNIPCVAVSTLEALAENLCSVSGYIVPCMDARRSQVYTAIFKSTPEGITRLCEDKAMSLSELADELKALGASDIYITGDGYEVATKALTDFGVSLQPTPYLLRNENAYSCAKVALAKYNRGEYTTDEKFAPTYLRMPQAERERLEKQNTANHSSD